MSKHGYCALKPRTYLPPPPSRFCISSISPHHVLNQIHGSDQGHFHCERFPEYAGPFQILQGSAKCREFLSHHFTPRSRTRFKTNTTD